MKKLKIYLIWILVIIGVSFIIRYNLLQPRKEVREKIIEEEGIYKIGEINVDTEKGEIQFAGRIFKHQGWVQHLIYLHGYEWLKEESAIISEANLSHLQKAIALLDWELWNELWYRQTGVREEGTGDKEQGSGNRSQGSGVKEQGSEVRSQGSEDRKLLISIKWDEKEIAAQNLVLTDDKLEIGDFIFLGSPYFDHMVLEAHAGADCRLCPVFPLKEEVLKEFFIRETGQSGYELNSALFPAEGTEVTIIIGLPK